VAIAIAFTIHSTADIVIAMVLLTGRLKKAYRISGGGANMTAHPQKST
jgi:hypothetical protein